MAPTTKTAPPSSVETLESVEGIPSQPSEEEDGLESDADKDDTFSQASDMTSYADDPTYRGIHNFDQDKCRVIFQVRTSKGDPICCGNEATECARQKHRRFNKIRPV
jgi:hypothetical protein